MLKNPEPTTKRCRICGGVKELADFHRAAGMRDGHRSECKECFSAISKERYARDPSRAIERTKRWRRENPEKYKAWKRRYLAANNEYRREWHRRYYLENKYGLSLDDYEFLMAVYDSKCAICGREQPDGLHVDHEHETGRIRGLLCGSCNRGIGLLQEDSTVLRAAADYLENPQYPLGTGDRAE